MEPMDRDRLAGYLASGNPNPFFPLGGVDRTHLVDPVTVQ
jgi:hypothetical protein